MKCFILAGGFATRLWPLTERRAKPLLPLAGKPLLTHIVEKIPPDIPITVSTNAVFADDMRQWAKTVKDHRIDIIVEDTGHDDHKLGALGATAKWLTENKIDDDLLLIAGDNYIGFSIADFVRAWSGKPIVAAIDIGELAKAKTFGTIIVDSSARDTSTFRSGDAASPLRIKGFEEKPSNPRSSIISTGVSILPKSTLPILIEFAKTHPDNIGGIFEELLRQGVAIDCRVSTESWKDIGSFKSYMEIHKQVVGDSRQTDPKATVDKETKLLGSISIGPGSKISNSTLTDCIIFGSATIDDCVLTECIIDEGCKLSGIDLSGKMLREGTILKRN